MSLDADIQSGLKDMALEMLRKENATLKSDRDKALRVAEEWKAHNDDFEARLIRVTEAYDTCQSDLSALRALVDEMAGVLQGIKAHGHLDIHSCTCGHGLELMLEKHTALKAGRETDSHNYRELLEWSLSVVGYYLDFHAQPGHANYDAKGLCFALHSYLKTPWAIKNAAAQKKEG